jgi:hypothetical protein
LIRRKKEVLGACKNGGKERRRKGESPVAADHDFIPADAPAFYCCLHTGVAGGGRAEAYPQAKYIQLPADGGGSNGSRRRQWKYELHKLSNETGIPIRVCHYPPGTGKWNKIEYRLFPFISMNWRRVPLTGYQTLVDLIRNTKTRTGLSGRCRLDMNKYDSGVRITDEQMSEIKLRRDRFHKDWNYTLQPSVRIT